MSLGLFFFFGVCFFPDDFPFSLASPWSTHAYRVPQTKMVVTANIDTVTRGSAK